MEFEKLQVALGFRLQRSFDDLLFRGPLKPLLVLADRAVLEQKFVVLIHQCLLLFLQFQQLLFGEPSRRLHQAKQVTGLFVHGLHVLAIVHGCLDPLRLQMLTHDLVVVV